MNYVYFWIAQILHKDRNELSNLYIELFIVLNVGHGGRHNLICFQQDFLVILVRCQALPDILEYFLCFA